MRRRLWVALLCVSATASAQPPAADENADALGSPAEPAANEGETAEPSSEEPGELDELPGDLVCAATLVLEGRTYQACESYVVVLREERVVRIYDLDVTPTDLFERSGAVWFELDGEAHALDSYEAREVQAPSIPSPPMHPLVGEPETPEPERPAFDGPADLDPSSTYGDRLAPERVDGFQLGLSVTPVLGSGIALTGDAFVAYRAERAFSARLSIDRIGYALSTTDGDKFGVFEGTFMVGYDHRIFEMSLGIGTTRARIDDFDRRLNGMVPTIAMGMRFGALDGLHMSVSTSLIVADGETTLSTIAVRMQWPLSVGRWLVIRGAGSGPSGYGWGEIGIRILTRGERGSGSLFITPAIGGGGLFDDLSFSRASGFAMSLGVEYRP